LSGIVQLLRANVIDAKLREIGVARNCDGSAHGKSSVRVIADVVADDFPPSRVSLFPHVRRRPAGK